MLVHPGAEGRITLINRKGCEILGWEEKDLLGAGWFDACMPRDIREKRREQMIESRRETSRSASITRAPS